MLWTGASLGDDELDGYALTANYSMGPGINVIGAIKYYDYESDFTTTASPSGSPSGAIFALGVVVGF